MAVPVKVLHALALVGKEEATYGTAIALTPANDGLQMQFTSDDLAVLVALKYISDGNIGPSISSLGRLQNVAPQGLYAEATIPMLLRLPGIAYSASIFTNIHRMLKMAGFDATGAFGAGVENWAFTPTAAGTGYTSLTLNAYERATMAAITGTMANLQISAKDGKPPIWSFPIKGIGALPTDQSPLIPASLAYPNSTVGPVLNVGASFIFGNLTAPIAKSWDFDFGRKFDNARLNLAGTNLYAGCVPSGRSPILKLVFEETLLQATPFTAAAAFDPYRLYDTGTVLTPVSIQLNAATQYNRVKLSLNRAQVTNVTRQGEGPTATVEVEVTPFCSTPLANDDITITFD